LTHSLAITTSLLSTECVNHHCIQDRCWNQRTKSNSANE